MSLRGRCTLLVTSFCLPFFFLFPLLLRVGLVAATEVACLDVEDAAESLGALGGGTEVVARGSLSPSVLPVWVLLVPWEP